MRSVFAAVLTFAPAVVLAQTTPKTPGLDQQAIFNMGQHAGRVWYATAKCGGEIAPAFKVAGGLARAQSEQTFTLGFGAGARDAEMNHQQNGREIGCMTSRLLYGPGGANVPGAWLPPPNLR